jgi:eukaryotic-like serine/threonine-protein kinase
MAVSARRTKDVFVAALEQEDPAARQAFLDRECADDPELRKRLDVLLQAHDAPASVLSRPFAEIAPETFRALPTVALPAIKETSGVVLAGRYKLVEEIGEGGMGTVWLAHQQEPVKRLVAVKLIKPGMDSKAVLARFEAERQALALMDHANIARVLDAGAAENGRPYFVMELVKGAPITRYCDEHHLTPRQRLELFVAVCQAIQHAHQKGIIHRDIKPSNVLVTLHDDKPAPKVIDFGVAKAMRRQLTAATLQTALGTVVGTVEYMSPEQANLNELDVDTRSDIYSLGVLLYELLTGSPPLCRREWEKTSVLDMLRVIREQEPPRPSTRLSELKDGLAAVSAQRQTEPRSLTKLVQGELDWIAMKALEKDRNRRYESASALAADVQRYLNDEPVEACPPSAWYRFRKLVRRNKATLVTSSALALAAFVTVVALAVSNVVIRQEQTRTRDEKERAEKAQAVAERRADEVREGLDRLKAANAWRERGQVYAEQLRWGDAHAALTRAIAMRPEHSSSWVERADLHTRLGLWELAAADFAREFELREPDATMRWYRYALLRLFLGDSDGYRSLRSKMRQRFHGTVNPFFATEVVRTCVLSPETDGDVGGLVELAQHRVAAEPGAWYPLYLLGLACYRAGKYEEAVQRLEESLTGTPQWSIRALSYPILAMAQHRLGRAAEARRALSAAGAAIDRWTRDRYQLADWRWMDHHDAAAHWPIVWWDWLECQLYRREASLIVNGAPPPDDPRIHVLAARALAAVRRPEQAAREYATALQGNRPDPQVRLEAHRNQAYRHVDSGQWSSAAAEFTRASELQPADVHLWFFRAVAHLGAGDRNAYRQTCAAMMEHFENTKNPRAARYVVYACVLRDDALPDMARLVSLARTADPAWNGDTYMLGAALYRAGRYDEAARCFDAATKTHLPRAAHGCFWAMAHSRLENSAEARRRLADAASWFEEAKNQEVDDPSGTRPTWAGWYEPVVYRLLLREAEAVVNQGGAVHAAKTPANARQPEPVTARE